LLDEPTNHLDAGARNSFYDFVRSFPGTLVAASHDRSLLRLMETIVELRPPEARVYGGNYDFYARERATQEAAEQAALRNAARLLRAATLEREETLEKQRERERQGRRRAPNAGIPNVLLGKMRQRAEQTRGRLASVHDDRVNAALMKLQDAKARARIRRTVRIEGMSTEQKGVCVSARAVNIELETGPLWKRPLDISIGRKDRIWLHGDNGTGKSSLARLLLGFPVPFTGTLRRSVQTALLTQDAELWFAEAGSHAGMTGPLPAPPPRFRGHEEMSGGERMHALLRQALESGAGLVVLDEPTNHLDLERTKALAESLRQYEGALLVITHDADFAEDAELTRVFEVSQDSVDSSG
jgi:ATPase subunit of ABC transporter with duplicated ATPase domains